MQELRGGRRKRRPTIVVLWPAFESAERAAAETRRISWYLGEHADSIRYASPSPIEAPGSSVSAHELEGVSRVAESLVLVWKYEGVSRLPVRALHRTRVVDPSFHDKCESLTTARLIRWDFATSSDTEELRRLAAERLVAYRAWSEGPAVILGTGPGLDLFARSDLSTYRTRVGCNSMVLSCLLYTSPSPRDQRGSRMPSSA